MTTPQDERKIIQLPQLSGGADRADALVDTLAGYAGKPVHVDARQLRASSQVFANRLVERLLTDAHSTPASKLVLVNASPDFSAEITRAASQLGVGGRVDLAHEDPQAFTEDTIATDATDPNGADK